MEGSSGYITTVFGLYKKQGLKSLRVNDMRGFTT